MKAPRLVVITETTVVSEGELVARLERAALLPPERRAALAVQLRDPDLPGRALFALGERLRRVTRALGASFVVNDRLDLALALEADGVHLGRRSVDVADARALLGPAAWISVACHGPGEVVAARDAGADAALLSPVFATPGKGAPLGLAGLREARTLLSGSPGEGRPFSLVALGGIDEGAVVPCLDAGADGVAAIRADLVSTLAR